MTKEALEKEAEEYVDRHWGASPSVIRALKQTYLASADPREKRIAELETQIEKMKCDLKTNIKWADENKNNQTYCKLNAMFNQWKIKEK